MELPSALFVKLQSNGSTHFVSAQMEEYFHPRWGAASKA